MVLTRSHRFPLGAALYIREVDTRAEARLEQRGVGALGQERLAQAGGLLATVVVLGALHRVGQQVHGPNRAEYQRVR